MSSTRWQFPILSLVAGTLILVADQVHKSSVSYTSTNSGVSFGLGAQLTSWPIITLLLVGALGVWLFLLAWKFHWRWWGWVGIGLTLGGGLSNVLDRWQHGAVRDTLVIPGTSIYNNLADYAIFLGVIAVILCFTSVGERHAK